MKDKFNYKKNYEFGEVIYPIDNGTRNRWAVVTKSREGEFRIQWFKCFDCANIFSLMLKNKIISQTILEENWKERLKNSKTKNLP